MSWTPNQPSTWTRTNTWNSCGMDRYVAAKARQEEVVLSAELSQLIPSPETTLLNTGDVERCQTRWDIFVNVKNWHHISNDARMSTVDRGSCIIANVSCFFVAGRVKWLAEQPNRHPFHHTNGEQSETQKVPPTQETTNKQAMAFSFDSTESVFFLAQSLFCAAASSKRRPLLTVTANVPPSPTEFRNSSPSGDESSRSTALPYHRGHMLATCTHELLDDHICCRWRANLPWRGSYADAVSCRSSWINPFGPTKLKNMKCFRCIQSHVQKIKFRKVNSIEVACPVVPTPHHPRMFAFHTQAVSMPVAWWVVSC